MAHQFTRHREHLFAFPPSNILRHSSQLFHSLNFGINFSDSRDFGVNKADYNMNFASVCIVNLRTRHNRSVEIRTLTSCAIIYKVKSNETLICMREWSPPAHK
jgi:hypothetical protein